jgi:hypothetical protein
VCGPAAGECVRRRAPWSGRLRVEHAATRKSRAAAPPRAEAAASSPSWAAALAFDGRPGPCSARRPGSVRRGSAAGLSSPAL